MSNSEKLKIAVYAISKNEGKFASRWYDSVKEADYVIVADTGSTDDTVGILNSVGAKVFEIEVKPWRFDDARNKSLERVPDDADICICCDLDEVFESGWRDILEKCWKKDAHTRARYTFVNTHNPDGSEKTVFPMEKAHTRKGYKWVHPVHEVLQYEGTEKMLDIPQMKVHHYPDALKPRSQYLPLLELSHAENPKDDRVCFWLGREYFFRGKWIKARETLTKYLEMESAVWDEERAAAYAYRADAAARQGDFGAADSDYMRAVATCPKTREPYMSYALFTYGRKDWVMTAALCEEALKITRGTGSYLTRGENWGSLPYDLAAVAHFRLGNLALASTRAKQALKFSPDDLRLLENVRLIDSVLEKETASKKAKLKGGSGNET